eukprot:720758-Prorocentrum_minimum.AAC.1
MDSWRRHVPLTRRGVCSARTRSDALRRGGTAVPDGRRGRPRIPRPVLQSPERPAASSSDCAPPA